MLQYLEKYVRLIYIGSICDFCTRIFIVFVAKARFNASTFLHIDCEAFLD